MPRHWHIGYSVDDTLRDTLLVNDLHHFHYFSHDLWCWNLDNLLHGVLYALLWDQSHNFNDLVHDLRNELKSSPASCHLTSLPLHPDLCPVRRCLFQLHCVIQLQRENGSAFQGGGGKQHHPKEGRETKQAAPTRRMMREQHHEGKAAPPTRERDKAGSTQSSPSKWGEEDHPFTLLRIVFKKNYLEFAHFSHLLHLETAHKKIVAS